MSTGKITNIKDIEIEALRQHIAFLELQVQGYRQNCERLERRIAELEAHQEEVVRCCATCVHCNTLGSEHPCIDCRNYRNWKPAK